jgi:hypothetical protein
MDIITGLVETSGSGLGILLPLLIGAAALGAGVGAAFGAAGLAAGAVCALWIVTGVAWSAGAPLVAALLLGVGAAGVLQAAAFAVFLVRHGGTRAGPAEVPGGRRIHG